MSAAISRAAVPLMTVCDMEASKWAATLYFGGTDKQPTLKLERRKPFPETYTYLVSSIIENAAEGRGLNFGDLGRDATTHRLSPVTTSALSAEAIRRLPAKAGRFELRWVPEDGKVPF
jgi:hypothetical protein